MGPSTQALFSLEWAAYLREEALRKGKEILWLNLDESNISVIMKNTRGSIKRLPKRGRWRWAAKIKAKLEHIRQTFTYVGLICSDPEIQPLLPQVILIGEKKVSWDIMNRLWEMLPNNVFLKRKGKGEWGRGWKGGQGAFVNFRKDAWCSDSI